MQPASEPSPRDQGARGAVSSGATVPLRSRGWDCVSDHGETYRDASSGSVAPSQQRPYRCDGHVAHSFGGEQAAANHGSRVLLALKACQTKMNDDRLWWPPRHATALPYLSCPAGSARSSKPTRLVACVVSMAQWHIHVRCDALAAPLCFLFLNPPRRRHYCTAILLPPAVRARAARYRSYSLLPITWISPTRRSAPAGSHASNACGKDSLRALALCHQLGRPRRS